MFKSFANNKPAFFTGIKMPGNIFDHFIVSGKMLFKHPVFEQSVFKFFFIYWLQQIINAIGSKSIHNKLIVARNKNNRDGCISIFENFKRQTILQLYITENKISF